MLKPDKKEIEGLQITNITAEDIELKEINILDAQIKFPKEIRESVEIKFGFDTQMDFDLEESTVYVRINCLFESDLIREDKEKSKSNFDILFTFIIKDLNRFVTVTPETFKVKIQLGSMLIMIAYSTARGIILTRTAGTSLEGLILPVIDPLTILPKPRRMREGEEEK